MNVMGFSLIWNVENKISDKGDVVISELMLRYVEKIQT